jgi:PAS domain S-box-containing protein
LASNPRVNVDDPFTASRPVPEAEASPARQRLLALVRRAFFGVAVGGNLLAALLLGSAAGVAVAARAEAAVVFGVLALLSLAGLRVPLQRLGSAMTGLMLLVVAAAAWTALRLGWGLAAPSLWALPLLVCVLCASAGWRAGALLALAAAAALGGVFVLQPTDLVLTVAPGAPAVQALGTLLLLVALGYACGATTAAVVARHVRAATDREQRFRGLLAVAVDAYWEIDQHYRIVALQGRRNDGRAFDAEPARGRLPWELPRFDCDADALDRLQADLDAREPFRDVPVRWLGRDGGADRLLQLSGEPRFDRGGVFRGYWGVARDITGAVAARQALAATENRYQELFTRSPTPLVLHRLGRVLDANAAALTLFGCADLKALRGQDLMQFYEAGDSRERVLRRIEELQQREPGSALPVTEYRLQVPGGTRWVRATGVRLSPGAHDAEAYGEAHAQHDGGGSVLSIFMDTTERRAAEDAVRRSEALLSHLVATSPDLITLTDLATGRLTMVNETFERVFGLSSAQVVGRTALELGLYADAEDREPLISRVRQEGRVHDLPTRMLGAGRRPLELRLSAARFVMDGRDYMVVNGRDVTDTERARLEREVILENASVGIAVTRDGHFVLANPAFEQSLGWERGTLAGQPGRVVWHSDADYAELGASAGPVLSQGGLFESERRMSRRDGSVFLARLRARAIDPRRPALGGTVWIVEDVTERREFERKLARARDQAEAASRAKSAFLANTSHELRTPLNGMIHMAEMARSEGLDESTRRSYLDQVAASARALAAIISDILDLSKIEAGKLHLEQLPFRLADLLQEVRDAHAAQAVARGLVLHFEQGPGIADAVVLGDPLRVRQILNNYVSNALKFTAHGEVRVSAQHLPAGPDGNRIRLLVQDTGPGIAAEVQQRLFQPFTQADESTTRRYGGTGLGLSICRELATLMQGEVGVTSVPGQGSRFWADLPLPAAATVASPGLADTGADTPADLRGARVLLVEDNPVNMMIATAMLERWGVQVEPATDGAQSLVAVRRAASVGQPFDAVLMDVQMPVMSGHEATRALRATEAGARLPIIALTAAAMVTERDEARAAGMNDFLTKPIDAERLRATLAKWVGGR